MPLGESIELKLKQSSKKIDNFIDQLLDSVRPQILRDAASHIIKAGGKRLRPYLVLKSCELVGGETEAAVPFAAAFELLHNFTLIHDDIMDNDEMRRAVSTVHARWGLPIAIASGDLLFAKVYEAMTSNSASGKLPCSRVKACIERATNAALALSEGQVLDTIFTSLNSVSEGDYFSMVGGKTAALFKACGEVGAIVGGGRSKDIERIGDFAWNAGIAFQLVDDYLGATSDDETLGKPVGSDLREGKKTLIIIHALIHASPREKEMIERVLGVKDASLADLNTAIYLMKELGSLNYAVKRAMEYANRAKELLDFFPDSEAKRDLRELIDFFMERKY